MNVSESVSMSQNDWKALLKVLDDYCDTDLEYVREASELRTPVLEALARAEYRAAQLAKAGCSPAYDVTVRTADKGFLAFEFRVPAGEIHVHRLYNELKADSRYVVSLRAVASEVAR